MKKAAKRMIQALLLALNLWIPALTVAQETQRGANGPRALFEKRLQDLVGAGKLSSDEARELLSIAFPRNEREAPMRMQAERPAQHRQQRKIEVKDPADFSKSQESAIFSGPQAGEKLGSFNATAIGGPSEGETSDMLNRVSSSAHLLIFQDDSGVALRGLAGFSRMLKAINSKVDDKLKTTVVFLGDDPASLSDSAGRLKGFTSDSLQLSVSPDGRDGPGNYGLNRNIGATILLSRDGVVTHNFAMPQPMLTPDPYVLGGLAELLDIKPEQLVQWLTEATAEQQRMQTPRR